MDRIIPDDVRRRYVMRRVLIAAIAVAIAAGSLAATVSWLRPSLRRRDVDIARVDRGPVDATLQASGTVVPETEQVISAPIEARILRIGRRAGDHLRAGDEILALDTSSTQLDLERIAQQLAEKDNESVQLRLKQDEAQATLRALVEQKKLDVQILQFKAQQNRTLRANGLVAEQEALASDTAARKSEIELAQLQEAIRRSARTGAAELAAAQLQSAMLRKEREQSARQLSLAMMRSDRDGVLTWVTPDAGATVRKGDVIARIADLSAFRVVATIADLHVARLAPGMRTRVKLDDATFVGGTIRSIDPRIEGGVAKFDVALDQPSHPRLRQNLRVDVLAIHGTRANALRLRRGSLAEATNGTVFVVRDDKLVRVPVRFGLTGEDYVEVLSGLREGDEVAVSNMSDWEGVKEIRLK